MSSPRPAFRVPARSWSLLLAAGGASAGAAGLAALAPPLEAAGVSGAAGTLAGALALAGVGLGLMRAPAPAGRGDPPLGRYASRAALLSLTLPLLGWGIPRAAPFYRLAAAVLPDPLPGALAAALAMLLPGWLLGTMLAALFLDAGTGDPRRRDSGWLAGAMIAGGGVGIASSGFLLLRHYGSAGAALAAAGALGGLALAARFSPLAGRAPAAELGNAPAAAAHRRAAIGLALGGAAGGMAAVVWIRRLDLLLGATVETPVLLLAVLFTATGLGAAGAALVGPGRGGQAGGHWLAAAGMVWSGAMTAAVLPYWPLNPALPIGGAPVFQLDLVRVVWIVLPAALGGGAALGRALAGGPRPAAAMGGAGAVLGAASGAAVAPVLIGQIGTAWGLVAAAALAVAAGLAAGAETAAAAWGGRFRIRTALAPAWAAATMLAAVAVPDPPPALAAWGRFMNVLDAPEVLYLAEGAGATAAVTTEGDVLNYHRDGALEGSSYLADMRLARRLAHLATLAAESPREVLVLGLGTGAAAGAAAIDPGVERVTVVEPEAVVREAARFFGRQNFEVLESPKVRVVAGQPRLHVEARSGVLDAVVLTPRPLGRRGTAALLTEEFWRRVRNRLSPGGVAATALPLVSTDERAVASAVAAFASAFPNALVAGDGSGDEAALILIGPAGETARIDLDRIVDRLADPGYAPIARSLAAVEVESGLALLGGFLATPSGLDAWLAEAPAHRDAHLSLRYLAADARNRFEAARIFTAVFPRSAPFPRHAFTGSPERMARLAALFESRRGTN